MLYPEGQFKVYSGKLISIEMELENIQSRLEMSSFIILIVAILTSIYMIFRIIEFGFDEVSSTITTITIILYFILWLKSYKFPLVCFVIALIVYTGNFILNSEVIFSEPFNFIAYRLSVPIILLIGIGNVFYSWYCISRIKKKEFENPDCVKTLIYIVKGRFIYDDMRFYDRIINNLDNSEVQNDITEITLSDSTQYLNYVIAHHAYGKYCQIFIEKPVLQSNELINLLFESELKNSIHIYASILINTYKESEWIAHFVKKVKSDMYDGQQDKNIIFILKTILPALKNAKVKDELYQILNRIKNGL